MKYVIDTSLLIDINRGNVKVLSVLKNKALHAGEPFITSLNFIEYYFGELGKGREVEVLKFLDSFKHLTLTRNSAKLYAELSRKYLKQGKTISAFDLLIAAIAIDNNMTLLTGDSDFEKINELKTEVIMR